MRQPTASLPAAELPPDWDSCPTTQIPAVSAPTPARHVQAPPPRTPDADATTTQANRKLAWLLAGVVAVAGGLLIGFLRANTPANVSAPVLTPRQAAGQDESPPSETPSQPLLATPELTGTSTTPPPSPVAAPPVRKVAPKPPVRPARTRVSIAARPTTAKPTTKPGAGSTSKNSKTYQPSNESPTVGN